MPDVQISHRTEYAYQRPVGLMPHRLMLRPQDSHDLRLHEATLTVDPPAARMRWAHDVFGNSICHLEWDENLRTPYLRIVSELALTHYPAGTSLRREALDPLAELYPFSYAADEIPDLARLTERQLPDPERQVDAWARRFAAREGGVHTLGLLEEMTRAIKAEFTYVGREAEGTQAPAETLSMGSGTCRDFAVLMMEAARSLGFAARFITGYLYEEPDAPNQGAGATHAWCGVYLPGAGWVEYDPTNGIIAGQNLIRVGVTRTPAQAMPVAGGFVGDPSDPLPLTVEVQARAVPAPHGTPGGQSN
ncbi:transglutaminase family protein [Roseococcus suduntuyensis]|uniref:Transglutaminase-like putative cysteine protease n=1 Tax=Roseococcus suduntuyensis TaxID=455361 RepID=A0A840ABF6_9PROT|nr:transglutaminase family protein [Roseococcus suduntuyensis]MBB3898889.1 transglutaminase-like putative cysteine protease [Roseococcus suduntuyensis]